MSTNGFIMWCENKKGCTFKSTGHPPDGATAAAPRRTERPAPRRQ
jgi:hypothetical protein